MAKYTYVVSTLNTIAGRITRDGHENNNALRNMQASFNNLANQTKNLSDLYETRSSTVTADAHFVKVSKGASQLKNSREKTSRELTNIMTEAVAEANREIASKVRLIPGPLAAEIRAHAKSLNSQDRLATIKGLADAGDFASLAAITESPAFLSGISVQEQNAFRDAAIQKACPETVANRDLVIERFNELQEGMNTTDSFVAELSDGSRLKSIEDNDAAVAALVAKLAS